MPLIISVLVHLCLVLASLTLPKVDVAPPDRQDVQIVYRNETKSKAKQIVTDVDPRLDEAVKDLKQEVVRLSQVTRRVREEQVAARNGETQNSGGGQPHQATQPVTDFSKQMREETKAKNLATEPTVAPDHSNDAIPVQQQQHDYDRPSITAPMPGSSVANQAHTGDSSISEYIPEVKVGGFTALNQDQFLYYTFYARINEQIRNRWVYNIRSVLNDTPQSVLARWADKPQVTELEILLSPDGKFVRSVLYRQAENPAIDNSAVSAFRLAAPFNNPPTEIVESDGFIHLHYIFHLEFRPSLIASGSR
jgi:TonB C terminal